ncbi:MAG: hypothetical protein JW832_16090 [Deltaproteobacteria bacterium]|nr:hypothetical protein [Deltaproteobacteria bacterium]
MTQAGEIWKYLYWLDDAHMEQLKAQMQARGIDMLQAKQNACEILLADIGYAAPSIWQVICKFDAAPWYDASPFAGKYIVASSRPLPDAFQLCLAATIKPVDFTPPAMPSDDEKQALVETDTFKSRVPASWWAFPKDMGAAIVAGLQKMFGSKIEHFDDLHRTWTAVHANFVCPAFRAGADCGGAPYSIADSAHISSCCVELFNMLGSPEPQLVRPCIGGVIVKALEKDRYYLMQPAQEQ